MTVQGLGRPGLHCVLEFPDGSFSIAKAFNHQQHISAHFKVDITASNLTVILSLVVIFDSRDVRIGQGFTHPTFKARQYVKVSESLQVSLKG